MDFQRIDKNTVQCRMTEEEMNEYGFDIEDFFTNQEKSREFLEQIVERAEEEVGYEVESGMISMQLMRMPDNSLTITFSDRGEDGIQNMLHHIQNLAGMIDESSVDAIMNGLNHELQSDKSDSEKSDVHISENIDRLNKEKLTEEEKKLAFRKHLKEIDKKNRDKANASKIYRFKSFHDLEAFASTIHFEKPVSSRLYKDDVSGDYYLLVKKGKLKYEEYRYLCQHLLEFAELCSQQPFAEQYCKEHYECLISKHALKVLRDY